MALHGKIEQPAGCEIWRVDLSRWLHEQKLLRMAPMAAADRYDPETDDVADGQLWVDCVEKIKALANWQHSEHFDEQERAILTYVEAMTITGQKVTETMLSDIQKWYDADALVELTALVSFQNLSAKFNTALDVPEQGF